jgi:DNA-binding transcriptional MerR regulator
MRIGELSRHSGVSVPTIKYYLREGLLAAGTATAANQADYDDAHLRRLRLIRALIDVGGVSVAAVRDVLHSIDDDRVAGHDLLGAAHHAVSPAPRVDRASPEWRAAHEEALALVRRHRWQVEDGAPALDALSDVIAALHALEQNDFLDTLDAYAKSATEMAKRDLAIVMARAKRGDRTNVVEGVVVGTVLGEAMFDALRRLAQEHTSALLFRRAPGRRS